MCLDLVERWDLSVFPPSIVVTNSSVRKNATFQSRAGLDLLLEPHRGNNAENQIKYIYL